MLSYTTEMFIADLGGIYGFALGISVITLLELFDWLLLKVVDGGTGRCLTGVCQGVEAVV